MTRADESIDTDLDAAFRICPYASTTDCYERETREPRFIAQGCRKWGCEICGPRRRWLFVLRIRAASPTRFITLTCRHEGEPSDQLRRITRALPRLITTLRKKHGSIEYLRMLETCQDGYPHFHLLARSDYLPQPEIKEHWSRLTDASIVDVRKAHGRSTGYIAKYLSKARSETGLWSRQRVSVSKGFWHKSERESDLIAFHHSRTHPQQSADDRPHLTYSRLVPGHYSPSLREPGDQLPPELRSTSGSRTS